MPATLLPLITSVAMCSLTCNVLPDIISGKGLDTRTSPEASGAINRLPIIREDTSTSIAIPTSRRHHTPKRQWHLGVGG